MTKNNLYIGLAIADSMFPPNCKLTRQNLSLDEVRIRLAAGNYTSCINPTHKATVQALQTKFGLNINTPDSAPNITMNEGDSLLCISVRGLPRLEGRSQYTDEEISNADFSYGLWTVQNIGPATSGA